MQSTRLSNPVLWIGIPATLVLAGTLISRGGGVESGVSGMPANGASMQPSCSACHSGSFGNGPQVSLTVGKQALQPGEAISVTTAAAGGGVSGSSGGFLSEVTAGAFTAGTGSQLNSTPDSITHTNNSRRSWTYGYTAGNAPGLVEMFSMAMVSDGGGRSGDKYSFSGSDPNSPIGTPVRLFVLPQGVTNVGAGCPDGFGNVSVLGASGVPSVGNGNFALELHGATPLSLGFALAGFNPPGFSSINLGVLFGLTGCNGYVANPISTLSGFTSAGNPALGDGSVTLALGIPNIPSIQGIVLDVQGAYIDPTAVTALGRSSPVSFSNGLKITVQ